MARITSAFFIAMTGCGLDSTTIDHILAEADRLIDSFVAAHGLSISTNAGQTACLAYAKSLLADRNRFDGTFDVSTLGYSHKGGTEAIINQLRQEAEDILMAEASGGLGALVSRVDA